MANDRDAIREAARDGAPDFYLAALLAPRGARADLVTVAAFAGEIQRIPRLVADPNLGEIRLQWWRDALANAFSGAQSGHPVCDAVTALIAARRMAPKDALSVIDAASYLFGTTAPDLEETDIYFEKAFAPIFRVQADRVAPAAGSPELLSAAAGAYGRSAVARDLVRLLAQGRMPLPLHYFGGLDPRLAAEQAAAGAVRAALEKLAAEARSCTAVVQPLLARSDHRLFPALLPLALVEPVFNALLADGRDPLRGNADISPLSRVTKLALARARGRV